MSLSLWICLLMSMIFFYTETSYTKKAVQDFFKSKEISKKRLKSVMSAITMCLIIVNTIFLCTALLCENYFTKMAAISIATKLLLNVVTISTIGGWVLSFLYFAIIIAKKR